MYKKEALASGEDIENPTIVGKDGKKEEAEIMKQEALRVAPPPVLRT